MLARIRRISKVLPNVSRFCQMRVNVWLCRFLPFSFSRRYLMAIGWLYYLLNRQEKRLIKRTITHVFRRKVYGATLKTIIQQTYQGIFDHYHEKLFIAYSRFKGLTRFLKQRICWVGEESLRAALDAGKGVILVTGHFGAVEFLPAVLALHGYPVSIVCRFQTNRLRESILERAKKVNLDIIDTDNDNSLLAAIKALKQGRILITECDEVEEWRANPDKKIYFLGARLDYDRALDILRKRSKAAVVMGLVKRNGKRLYTLDLTPVANGAEPINTAVGEQCLRVLEQAIHAHPEQWYQWKKFGKMIYPYLEDTEYEYHEGGYLAPAAGLSIPGQA